MTVLNERVKGAEQKASTFSEFVEDANPTLLDYEHVPRMVSVLQRVADGELDRVMILMPPRYFKSETVSRLFSAYWLLRNPQQHVGLASYGAQLAWELSEEARNHFEEAGGQLMRETAAKRRWRTSANGEMWADGVGGSLLGRGYHLGLVDDPTDPEKAHSPTYQKRFKDWWPAKFLSRQEPGAAVVLIMQRLGTDDPVEWLWRREVGDETDEAPEHWHVVCFDEIKSDAPLSRYGGERGLPPTCTLEPDKREVGDVLAPSRFDKEAVERLQLSAGTYVANAQRQQRPSAPTGDFWREEWFQVFDELPDDAHDVGRDWDTAYTKDESNSASANIQSYRDTQNPCHVWITEGDWDWFEFPELVSWMRRLSPPHYVEEKASGKSTAQVLTREGIPVSEVAVDGGDKFARASAAQPVAAAGRVHIHRSIYRKILKGDRQGILRVTAEALLAGGPDLDLNDAFVQTINRHTGNRESLFWIE